MKFNFVGRCNREIPNTIVLDEAAKWRVILGGILKIDKYDTMDEAAAAVDRVTGTCTESIPRSL